MNKGKILILEPGLHQMREINRKTYSPVGTKTNVAYDAVSNWLTWANKLNSKKRPAEYLQNIITFMLRIIFKRKKIDHCSK